MLNSLRHRCRAVCSPFATRASTRESTVGFESWRLEGRTRPVHRPNEASSRPRLRVRETSSTGGVRELKCIASCGVRSLRDQARNPHRVTRPRFVATCICRARSPSSCIRCLLNDGAANSVSITTSDRTEMCRNDEEVVQENSRGASSNSPAASIV